MATSLTAVGIFWAALSLGAALFSCTGFYVPYWIRGKLFNTTEATFGSFRRCTYPKLLPNASTEIIFECGRYTSFGDIPSIWWQITTITVGIGASLALLVSFTALAACVISNVVTRQAAKGLGIVQLVAAVLISAGCAVYPNGWKAQQVKDVCGGISNFYDLGTCEFSWSAYLLLASIVMLVVCAAFSFHASRLKPYTSRI